MNVRRFSILCLTAACLCFAFGPARADKPKGEKKEEKQRSPYAGTYTGTYTASNSNGDQEGETTLTVDDDGKVTGEANAKGTDDKLKIKGTLLKDNKAVLLYEAVNGAKSNAYGTVSKTASGGITGTLMQRFGGQAVNFIEFEVSPKAK